jgi:5'-nucleotidase
VTGYALTAQTPGYQENIHTAIVTAHDTPAHERAVTTLKNWGGSADESFS